MSRREFTVEGAYTYNRRGTVPWIISHIARYRGFILALVLTTLVSNALSAAIPSLTGLAFNHALGIPIPAWIMLGVFLVALYVQRSTYFGRDVYAVGGSADAARLSGVRVGNGVNVAVTSTQFKGVGV